MKNSRPEPLFYQPTKFYVPWDWKDVGYGEICVSIENRGQDIKIWNEGMTRGETREILYAFVEKIMKNGQLMEVNSHG